MKILLDKVIEIDDDNGKHDFKVTGVVDESLVNRICRQIYLLQ